MPTSELRQAIEFRAKKYRGACAQCGTSFGGDPSGRELHDLISWLFGFCTNACRRDSGQPEKFDLEEMARILAKDAN
jgi:hypothetical protein